MLDKEKRVSVSISLTNKERDELKRIANEYGLSLSAFLRLAAKEYTKSRKLSGGEKNG